MGLGAKLSFEMRAAMGLQANRTTTTTRLTEGWWSEAFEMRSGAAIRKIAEL